MVLPHERNPHDLLQESLALCERLEQGLVELEYNHRSQDDLVQVTHTLKSLIAQKHGDVAHLAHRLETIFRSLEQQPDISSELVEMVLQAYEYLRLLLIAQSQEVGSDIAEALAQAELVFTQLESQLNCQGDTTAKLAGAEVEQVLKHLEKILSDPSEPFGVDFIQPSEAPADALSELKFCLNRLLELGEVLEISEFVAIARSTTAMLEMNAHSASTVGKIALAGFHSVQASLESSRASPPEVVLPAQTPSEKHERRSLLPPPTARFLQFLPEQDREDDPKRSPMTVLTDPEGVPSRQGNSSGETLCKLKIAELFVWRAASYLFTIPYSSIEEHLTNAECVQFGEQRFLHWRQQVIPFYQLFKLLNQDLLLPAVSSLRSLATPPSEFTEQVKSGDIKASLNGQSSSLKPKHISVLPSACRGRSGSIIILRQEQLLALESEIDSLISEPELIVIPFSHEVSCDYCYGYTTLANGDRLPVIDVVALLRQAELP